MSEKASGFHSNYKCRCKRCGKDFTCRYSLTNHWLSYHAKNFRSGSTDTYSNMIYSRDKEKPVISIKILNGKKAYLCKICRVVFKQRCNLDYHVKTHEVRPCIYDTFNEAVHHKSGLRKNDTSDSVRMLSVLKSSNQTRQDIKTVRCREGHRKYSIMKKCMHTKLEMSMHKARCVVGSENSNYISSGLVLPQESNKRNLLHKCKIHRKKLVSSKFLRKEFSRLQSKDEICSACKRDSYQVLGLLKHFRTTHAHVKLCHCSVYRKLFNSSFAHKKILCRKIEKQYYGTCNKKCIRSNQFLRHKRQVSEENSYNKYGKESDQEITLKNTECSGEENVSTANLEDQGRISTEQRNKDIPQGQNVAQVGSETYGQPFQDVALQDKSECGNEWLACVNPFEVKYESQSNVSSEDVSEEQIGELPDKQPVQGVVLEVENKVSIEQENEGESSECTNRPLQDVLQNKSNMLPPIQTYEVDTSGLYNKQPVQESSLKIQDKVLLERENGRMASEFPGEQIVQVSIPVLQSKNPYDHGNERIHTEFIGKQTNQDAAFDYQRRVASAHGVVYKQSVEEVTHVVERSTPTGYSMLAKENTAVTNDSNRIPNTALTNDNNRIPNFDYYQNDSALQRNVYKHTFYQENFQKGVNVLANKVNFDSVTKQIDVKPNNLPGTMACLPPGTNLQNPGIGEQFYLNTMLYKCKFCNVVFGNCEAFQWHLSHAHSKDSFYECYICRTKYTDRSQFTTHLQSHTPREMHNCTFCKEGLHICEIGFHIEGYRQPCLPYNEQNYNNVHNHELNYQREQTGNLKNQGLVYDMGMFNIGQDAHISSCSKTAGPEMAQVPNMNYGRACDRGKFAVGPKNYGDSSLAFNVGVGEIPGNIEQKHFDFARFNVENLQQNRGNYTTFQINRGPFKIGENLKEGYARFGQNTFHKPHENTLNHHPYGTVGNVGYEGRLLSVVNNNFAHSSGHNPPCSSGNNPGWGNNEICNEDLTQVLDILCNPGQANDGLAGKDWPESKKPKQKRKSKSKKMLNQLNIQQGLSIDGNLMPGQDLNSGETNGEKPNETGGTPSENSATFIRARIYECNVCHRKFEHECNLQLHMKVHEPKEDGESNKEEKEEPPEIPELLLNPEDLIGKKGIYSCKVCNKHYASAAELKMHKSTHWETRLFFCNICKKDFRQYANLVRHKEGVHERLKPNSCNLCSKSFHTVSQLNIHRKAVHEKIRLYQCDTCPKRFSCKFNMLRHREKMHDKMTGKLDSAQVPKKSPKDPSQKKGRRRKKDGSENQPTDGSQGTHDGNDDANEAQDTENSKDGGKGSRCKKVTKVKRKKRPKIESYSCDICKEIFKTVRLLKEHWLSSHEPEGYFCSFCGKEFFSVMLLSRHEKIHINKVYECCVCKQKFHRKFLYDRHIKESCPDGDARGGEPEDESNTHGEEQEMISEEIFESCKICEKTFRPGGLQRHLLYAHKEDKQFSCVICNRQFAGKCHLVIHKKCHTQRSSFDCMLCINGTHVCEKGFIPDPRQDKESGHGVGDQNEEGLESEVDINDPLSNSQEDLCADNQLRQECYSNKPFVLLEKLETNKLSDTEESEDAVLYPCKYCSKQFEKSRTLNLHVSYAHPEARPFVCEICKRDFPARRHLMVHAKSHALILPPGCKLCMKQMHICEKGYVCNKWVRKNSDQEEDYAAPSIIDKENVVAMDRDENKGNIQDNQVIDNPDCQEFNEHIGVSPEGMSCIEGSESGNSNDCKLQEEIQSNNSEESLEVSCFSCKIVFANNDFYMGHLPCKGVATELKGNHQEIQMDVQGDLTNKETINNQHLDNNSGAFPKGELLVPRDECHKTVIYSCSDTVIMSENLGNCSKQGCYKKLDGDGEKQIKEKYNEENDSPTVTTGKNSDHEKTVMPKSSEVLGGISSNICAKNIYNDDQSSSSRNYEKEIKERLTSDKYSSSKRPESRLMVMLMNRNLDQRTIHGPDSFKDSLNDGSNRHDVVAAETHSNFGLHQQRSPLIFDRLRDSFKSVHPIKTELMENNAESTNNFGLVPLDYSQTSVPSKSNECNLAGKVHLDHSAVVNVEMTPAEVE